MLQEASYGQVQVKGAVFGPFNLTRSYTSCTDVEGAIRDDAFAAAIAAGVNLNNYNRYVMIFTSPSTWTSTCAGCADVGSCTTVTSSGTFNGGFFALNTNNMVPPFSWITNRQVGVALGCHELGHSIGMLHSGILTPATITDVVGPLDSPGSLNDGGDNNACNSQGTVTYLGHSAANEEAAVGWLPQNSSGYELVQYPGTYTIVPYEGGVTGLKAIKVQRGTNNAGYYLWLEYRLQSGLYDSTSQWASNGSGVFVHYEDPSKDHRQGYLLNFNPQLNTSGGVWMNPEMQAGQRWNDKYSDLTITLVSQSSAGATVSIGYANGGGSTTSGSTGSSLTCSVSVPFGSYTRNQIVPIDLTATASGVPASGAAVMFTLKTPNGKKLTQTATTGSTGQAIWNYSLGKNPTKGTYSVTGSTTYGGTTALGTATFTVN